MYSDSNASEGDDKQAAYGHIYFNNPNNPIKL